MRETGTVRRLEFVVTGLLAGISFWQLSNLPWQWQDSEPFLATAVLALSFFAGLLAMLGVLGLRRALIAAAAIAIPAAVLVLIKAQSFADTEEMMLSGHVPLALIAVMTLPVPFAIAMTTEGRKGWCDYARLFNESWNIVVRYAAAWLFVALVWAVLGLLWSLLDLVGIDFVEDFLTRQPVVWLVSGAVMGLALAVVTEFSDTISADLLLRLLRLLLPLVLVVEVVFVAVLPLSGLEHLFGVLSPTGIVVATALGSIALVTIAVDADDGCAVQARAMTLSARGLALLAPVLAALAVWSLGLRVFANGWTPERVAGAFLIAILCGYGVFYAAAVISGAQWREWIRKANIVMALVTIVAGVLWMTPLVSAERISARSQLARYEAGVISAEELPLSDFAYGWGTSGQRALEKLRQQATQPGQDALARAFARLDGTAHTTATAQSLSDKAKVLATVVKVLPQGTEVPLSLMMRIATIADDDWVAQCRDKTQSGQPACVLVLGDFTPLRSGREAIFVRDAPYDSLLAFQEAGDTWQSARPVFLGTGAAPSGAALIAALIGTGGKIGAADLNAVQLPSQQLSVVPYAAMDR